MSLQPQGLPPVPEDTSAAARAAFPRGNRYMKIRDEFGVFYTDQDFAALFPTRGQPAETPWRLALVLVFQFAEGLSDEQAAEAVRARIDWKYALSLELTDSGFDASVLSEFRSRLVQGQTEPHLLDGMLERLKSAGLLKARGRQRTDSTHILAAVRALNRLECVGETMRRALNALAVAAPAWLSPHLVAEWPERYGTRFDDYRLPKAAPERQSLAEQVGADGRRLLAALFAPSAPVWLRELPAVRTLQQVWVQQFYALPADQPMRWRKPEDAPPAAQMINSPYDPEARYSKKRNTTWAGYKVHLTETCDEDRPHLITHVLTTSAPLSDWEAIDVIHPALAQKDLLPAEHLVDAGYVDSGVLVSSQSEHQVRVVGPVSVDTRWQARAAEGFDGACFTLDWEARVATCPQGTTSRKWSQTHDSHGGPIINIRFDAQACTVCPVRDQCTHSADGPRHITVRPQPQHEALLAARRHQQTAEFKAEYQDRAGIEGTLSQGLRIADLRRSRYLGLAKTHLQHILTAAAINLRRLGDWLTEHPRAETRTSSFLRLVRAASAS